MKYLFVFIMMPLMLFCNALAEAQKPGPNKVVISFKNKPDIDNYFYFTKTNWQQNTTLVTILHDDQEDYAKQKPNVTPPDFVQVFDDSLVILRVAVNHLDVKEFLSHRGDSVRITYVNQSPQITISNRNVKKFDIDFDGLVRSRLRIDQYSPIGMYWSAVKLRAKKLLSDKNLLAANQKLSNQQRLTNITKETDAIKKELYPSVMGYLSNERIILDSIRSKGEISSLEYEFYKDRNSSIKNFVSIETDQVPVAFVQKITKNKDESKFPDVYRKELLKMVADKFLASKADFKDLKDGVNRNYKQVFLMIDTSSLFRSEDRDFLLTREIKRIHRTSPHPEFLQYFNKYASSVKDTKLVQEVRNSFALEFDETRNETSSIILTTLNGKKLTFSDLKERHKGKILYVDFWASWCGPCREAMPSSAALRESMKNKDIEFIYLSIDNSLPPWKSASNKENLNTLDNNFLIVNHKSSEFFKRHKLNEIPRYMIFDKSGKLVNANAPRVESAEIGLVLNKLIEKP